MCHCITFAYYNVSGSYAIDADIKLNMIWSFFKKIITSCVYNKIKSNDFIIF